jgi:alcohol dehydrogenase
MRGRTLQPTVAICDPDLTIGLPPQLTATTGIDALSHALEGYVCTRIPNPYTDLLAEKAVELINGNLRQAYANGNNILAREKMLLASNMALMAAGTSGGLGLAHALAHAIGGFYDLPHGLIVAVCLPHVLRYNAIAVP